jgi:hypothetical protein
LQSYQAFPGSHWTCFLPGPPLFPSSVARPASEIQRAHDDPLVWQLPADADPVSETVFPDGSLCQYMLTGFRSICRLQRWIPLQGYISTYTRLIHMYVHVHQGYPNSQLLIYFHLSPVRTAGQANRQNSVLTAGGQMEAGVKSCGQ